MKYQYCLLITILFSCACSSRTQVAKQDPAAVASQPEVGPQPAPITPETEQSVTELISQTPFLEKEKKSTLLRTWKRIPNHATYRAVRPGDFRIPHWVEKEYYWADVARATGWPADCGEMSGAYGCIIFMVDKTKSDTNCFSIVVFIERPGNKYSVHWIFRDRDLSRVNLLRRSGDVYLQEFRDDGTSHSCDVQWNRKQARWGCDLD